MKNCQFCQAELDDHAVFCSHCGNKQGDVSVAAVHQVPPVPPYPYPPQPTEPKEPSALALDAQRYGKWLKEGIFGTTEPMHILFAAAIPFVITLLYALSGAKLANWHAGAFFLSWFFSIVQIAAMPAVAWLVKRHMMKQDATFEDTFSTFASFHTIVLPIALLVMIFGFSVSVSSAGGLQFIRTLRLLIPVLSLSGATLVCLHDAQATLAKKWQVVLVLVATFLMLHLLDNTIQTAGVKWGLLKSMSNLFR